MVVPIFLDEVLSKLGFVGKVNNKLMLSMDIAPTSTGWVLTYGSQLVDLGFIAVDCVGHNRIGQCYAAAFEVMKSHGKIDWLVVEDYSGQRGWNNLQIGEVSAAMRLAYIHSQVPWSSFNIVYISPKRLPSFIGKNKVEKKERIEWVELIFPAYKELIAKYHQRQKEDITDAMLLTLLSLCARSYLVQPVELNPSLSQILVKYKPLCEEFK